MSRTQVLDGLGFRHTLRLVRLFRPGPDGWTFTAHSRALPLVTGSLVGDTVGNAVPTRGAGAQVLRSFDLPLGRSMWSLHAAQHGPAWETPMEDLRRALDIAARHVGGRRTRWRMNLPQRGVRDRPAPAARR